MCPFIYTWSLAFGQRAEAPVYNDWWRVRHEATRVGFDVSGTCQQIYPEYLVRIQGGRANVFGVNDDRETAIKCPLILRLVLGKDDLKFPLYLGLSWSERRSWQVSGLRRRSVDYTYEVNSWETTKTPKGEFDAFKIVKSFPISAAPVKGRQVRWQTQTYYYAPSVKAIVQYRLEDEGLTAITTLVDFSQAQ